MINDRTDIPANRKRYRNVTVWLYEGLDIPNVAKTLRECYTKVMEALCWKQPTANVIKTFNCLHHPFCVHIASIRQHFSLSQVLD